MTFPGGLLTQMNAIGREAEERRRRQAQESLLAGQTPDGANQNKFFQGQDGLLQATADMGRGVAHTGTQVARAVMDDPYGALKGAGRFVGSEMIAPLYGALKRTPENLQEGNYGSMAADFAGALPLAAVAGSLLDVGKGLKTLDAASATGKFIPKAGRAKGAATKFVGAPPGVESAGQLARLRAQMRNKVEEAAIAFPWYRNSGAAILEGHSGDVMKARHTNDAISVTSQGTGLDTNLGFTNKALSQQAAGDPIATGRFPTSMGRRVKDALSGFLDRSGMKIVPFSENLSRGGGYGRGDVNRPVHDIWDGRAWGYTEPDGSTFSRGFGTAQHRFLDREYENLASWANKNKIGGHDDWDAGSLQASIWVHAKAQSELAKGTKYRTLAEAIEGESKDFSHLMDSRTANATHEQIPGAGTGQLPGLLNASDADRAAYSAESTWRNAHGNDAMYDAAGLLVRPTRGATGAYTPPVPGAPLETNPVEVARPMVETAGTGGVGYGPSGQRVMDSREGTRAYIDAQNAGAHHMVDGRGSSADRNSLRLPMNRPLTPEEMRTLHPVAEAQGFGLVDTGDGATFLNFGGGPTNSVEAARAVKPGTPLGDAIAALNAGRPTPTSVGMGYVETGLNEFAPGSGGATRRLFDETIGDAPLSLFDSPGVRAKAGANLERDARWSQRGFGPVREDIQNARRIIASEGLAGLKRALQEGKIALPAVAAIVGASAAQEMAATQKAPSQDAGRGPRGLLN